VNEERIAKYEAWARELEARAARLAAHRAGYLRLFAAVFALSFVGFAWSPWIGSATSFSGALVFVFGYYTLAIRRQDYARELAEARAELEKLRA
jgi:hypothetical protein